MSPEPTSITAAAMGALVVQRVVVGVGRAHRSICFCSSMSSVSCTSRPNWVSISRTSWLVDVVDQFAPPAAEDGLADVLDAVLAAADFAGEVAGQRIVLEQLHVPLLGGRPDPADGLGRRGAVGIVPMAGRQDFHVGHVPELELGGEHVVLRLQLDQRQVLLHLRDVVHLGDPPVSLVRVGVLALEVGHGFGEGDVVEPVLVLRHQVRIVGAPSPGQIAPQVPDLVVPGGERRFDLLAADAELGALVDDAFELLRPLSATSSRTFSSSEGSASLPLRLGDLGPHDALVEIAAQLVVDVDLELRRVGREDVAVAVEDLAAEGLELLGLTRAAP